MNNRDLKSLLAAYKIPAPNDGDTARALDRSLTAWRNAPPAPMVSPERALGMFSRWHFAAAILLLAVAVFVLFRSDPATPNAPLLTELESLFPGELQGVITHNGTVELLLAPAASPRPEDQRIAVEFRGPDEKIEVLTYSGNEVCLDLPGGRVCFTPLLSGSGEIYLVGRTGLLESSAQWRISTQRIDG